MAFESLSSRLQTTLKKFSGQGKLTEQNMDEMLTEIRLALLEADVNFQVVKEFIANTKEKALGKDVLGSLKPGQVVVKVVHDELVTLLGTTVSELDLSAKPTIIMMVGLQGSGKTTTAGKIAKLVAKKEHKRPLLIAGDIYRPAAIDQLKTVGQQINIPVFEKGINETVENIVKDGLAHARENNHDLVIIDTAGRLQIDDALMQELENVKQIANPNEILLVVDSLSGQEIVNVAQTFNERLDITGAVLTKLDGDARGGGALSIRHITNVPIKFVGTGEKLDQIDLFYPDRMADRILGMGDVVSLVERVQDIYDEEDSLAALRKMQSGRFGLDDMLKQLAQLRKLGPLSGILKMLPGVNLPNINDEDTSAQLNKMETIIFSMTLAERRDPSIITASRKQRIAKGCGKEVSEVNQLLKRFEESKKMMKMFGNIDPNTGLQTGKPKNTNYNPGSANRKKVRHKKKKKK